jgi:spore germination cell wall hydrolase CwlJ-like protein
MTKLLDLICLAIVLLFTFCVYSYVNAEENNIVARVIAAEACGEGKEGMQAVANVIRNRSRKWRQPIVKVVTARNQFYGYSASNRDRLYSQCKEVADELASNIEILPDITNGALYFRQPSEPIYSWHGEQTVVIKNHIFHKER